MSKKKANSDAYPEAWKYFTALARNMEGEEEEIHGKYRIPKPDMSGEFIYANHTGILFSRFRQEFYKPGAESPSLYGKIQYIVEKFKN